MPTASGTSIIGLQTLINGASATTKQFSIAITSAPIPPVKQLGYFWLYAVTPAGPNQSYILKKGILSTPGYWDIWVPPATSPTYLFRVDVRWAVASRNWTVSIT